MCDKVMSLTGADKRSLYIDPSDKSKSFANLWRKEQNHSSEYIFSLEGDVTNGARYHGVTFVNAGWGLYNTWGYYTPSKELWDAFEEGDQRREATILYPGNHVRFMGRDITFGGYCTDGSITSYTTSHVSAGLINQKFISPWETGSYSEVSNQRDKLWNTLNCCLMRYADVMLMKAEALIWTKGEGDAEAKNLLDDIRERAGLPRDSRATKAQLQNERRCELAFEFQPPYRRGTLGAGRRVLLQTAAQRRFEDGRWQDRNRGGGGVPRPHVQSDLQQGVPDPPNGFQRHGEPHAEQRLLTEKIRTDYENRK